MSSTEAAGRKTGEVPLLQERLAGARHEAVGLREVVSKEGEV